MRSISPWGMRSSVRAAANVSRRLFAHTQAHERSHVLETHACAVGSHVKAVHEQHLAVVAQIHAGGLDASTGSGGHAQVSAVRHAFTLPV